jgi:shikimate 5-dehydrogenase
MAPEVDAAPIRGSLCGNALVMDAIYNPPVTRLLREATAAGATIIPGTAMFLRQAAKQFSVFAGISPGLRTLSALMRESSRA